jgi:hypothetical protein
MMIDLKQGAPGFGQSRIRDWAWSPRYAKIWWALAVTFWAAKLASHSVVGLDWLNEPGVAGYLTAAFFPPMMFLVLGLGRIKARQNTQPTNYQFRAIDNDLFDRRIGPSGLPAEIDPLDPESGLLWVGNSLNPLNAARINHES